MHRPTSGMFEVMARLRYGGDPDHAARFPFDAPELEVERYRCRRAGLIDAFDRLTEAGLAYD